MGGLCNAGAGAVPLFARSRNAILILFGNTEVLKSVSALNPKPKLYVLQMNPIGRQIYPDAPFFASGSTFFIYISVNGVMRFTKLNPTTTR